MLPVWEGLSSWGHLIMCCFMPHIAYLMRLCFQSALHRSNDLLPGCNMMRQPIPTIMTMWMRNLLTQAGYLYPNNSALLKRKNKLLCQDLFHQKSFHLPEPPLLAWNSMCPRLLPLLPPKNKGRELCCLPWGSCPSKKEGFLSSIGILLNNWKNGAG